MKPTLIGILCCLLLVGCTTNHREDSNLSSEAILTSTFEERLVDVYIPKNVERGLYEPDKGIYIGAYVENSSIIDQDMKKFEELVGKKHAMRVMQYRSSQDVGGKELLQCLANKQTPYIKVLMTADYDLTPIYHLVSDIKTKYEMPIFIELYPLVENMGDPERYKSHYQAAYELIKRHVKDAVIVWSMDMGQVSDYMSYYPGDRMVDWIGLNTYIPQYADGTRYNQPFKKNIDLWYKSFQGDKPLILSGVALSHYSRVDHTYRIDETETLLNYFYDTIPELYPRIKGMLYIDVDMSEVSKRGKENYALSTQKDLISAYNTLVESDKFLQEVEDLKNGSLTVPMKYTVSVLDVEGAYYMEKEYARALFNTLDMRKIKYLDYIDGNRYYEIDNLVETYNMKHVNPIYN
nr:glycosyl hydrolase [uncultured Niameybacter sp.]